ncbi:9350_t:CDS:2 [Acaulospora morrowiae]|uniref:9350_t:CDS:1 n=1 Tax=Acaulospora morrowiae TaxID=94023 RepID=A0A9N8WII2_9GLOM|nr:9350_t:CDS:2 [Acaulospora morrowiae]
MKKYIILLSASLLAISTFASADIYLKETFSDDDWTKRWVYSKHRDDLGKFELSAGQFYAHEVESRGLKTSEDARFYAISTKLDKVLDNSDKDLVVQFSVKHEQNIDCGGGYVKLLPPEFDPLSFKGESPYNIMFGPDICGSTRKVHVILGHKGENKQVKKEISAPSDQLTHLYTLVLKSNHTYTVFVDNKEELSGTIEDDFDLLPPKEIKDPDAKKPEDWVDLVEIPDPDDVKPTDWVDGPETIPDPEAKKPDDWDDDMDGDWEPPQIANPDYKGEWKQKLIPNPEYKGPWSAPLIPNPEYKEEPSLHAYKSAYIGFDLWQVKSGTIFDNILITDDVEFAKEFAEETFVKFRETEKEAKRKLDKTDEDTDGSESKDKEEDEDDIIDMEVKVGDDGKVVVSEPDPSFDLKDDDKPKPDDVPPVVEQIQDDLEIDIKEDKKVEETSKTVSESTDSSSVSEESATTSSSKPTEKETTTSLSSPVKQERDEFDDLFEEFEQELSSPKRDEL